MKSRDLKRAKREVRGRVRSLRDATTPEERQAWAESVSTRCLGLPEISTARMVMAFWAFGSELPTVPMMEALLALGTQVALPRIVNGDLEVRTWNPGDPMTQARFGALEPAGGRLLEPTEVDVVLTPSVAFDRMGGRVGYGGGFYDRFFPTTSAARVGVGFSLQVMDDPLPAGAFDLRVQIIVTEDEVIRP